MTAKTATRRTFTIPASRRADAVAKVVRANRRIERLGLTPYTLTFAPTADIVAYDAAGNVLHRWAALTATVTGETPKLGDWTPVATLIRDNGPTGGVVTRVWPNLDVEPRLDMFRNTPPQCDHCNKRRHRKDTYVLMHRATGAMQQVGKTCLTAFTGVTVSLATALAAAESIDSLDEWTPTADDLRWPVLEVLTLAAAAATCYGWRSKKTAQDTLKSATADVVDTLLLGSAQHSAPILEDLTPHMDAARTLATAVREYAANLTGRSEYEANLATVAAAETVGVRNLALLVSAVGAYDRAHNTHDTPEKPVSEWLGEVGDTVTVSGTVTVTRPVETKWGVSTLIAVVDDHGNEAKWFKSGRSVVLAEGDTVTLTGKVKKLDLFQERKATLLTRCKVTDHVSTQPATVELEDEDGEDYPDPFECLTAA